MMTVKEVAERLAVSEACVYQLVENRRLWVHRIGLGRGTIRVSEQDLETYLAQTRIRKAEKGQPRKRRGAPLVLNHLTIKQE